MHEEDGGHDVYGARPLNGVKILQKHIDGINAKAGNTPVAWDDVNEGNFLDFDKVIAARQLEMQYFDKINVYERVPREEMLQSGGKIIDTRWIDTNKADEANPEYRSRLVGR